MTAVLEPQQAAPAASSVPVDAAPQHCGGTMVKRKASLDSLLWGFQLPGSAEWICPCGFRQDAAAAGEPLHAVRTAAARVESLQWELDAAKDELLSALRTAAANGSTSTELIEAAGLPDDEFARLLL